jgi:hypothetical protein
MRGYLGQCSTCQHTPASPIIRLPNCKHGLYLDGGRRRMEQSCSAQESSARDTTPRHPKMHLLPTTALQMKSAPYHHQCHTSLAFVTISLPRSCGSLRSTGENANGRLCFGMRVFHGQPLRVSGSIIASTGRRRIPRLYEDADAIAYSRLV